MEYKFSPSVSDRLDTVISNDQSLSIDFTRYLIDKRLVRINRRYCRKPSVHVTPEDIITIMSKQRNLDPSVLADAPNIDIPVIFAHTDYLVLHKAKGVLTHPTTERNIKFPSVTGFLYHYTRLHRPDSHQFIRASIVHRLDRDTDWLMVVALTEKGLFHFRALFTAKSKATSIEEKEKVSLNKRYHARVLRTPERHNLLSSKIYPWYHVSSVIAKTVNSVPKEWITKVCAWQRVWNDIILECEILTGRTHQIRYHCAELGMPIIWDHLYNPASYTEDWSNIGLSSVYLSFVDSDGIVREWSIA